MAKYILPAALRKAEDPHMYEQPPLPISEHPLFTGQNTVTMVSGENPKFKPIMEGEHDGLRKHLQNLGHKFEETHGSYGMPERSFIVHGLNRDQAHYLGKIFGQEAVVHSPSGGHGQEMLYCNGEHDGKFHPRNSMLRFHPKNPFEDYYTHVPGHGYLYMDFDFGRMVDSPIRKRVLAAQAGPLVPIEATHPEAKQDDTVTPDQVRKALLKSLKKTCGDAIAGHPHAYPWHDGHHTHHPHVIGPGGGFMNYHSVKLSKAAESASLPTHPDWSPQKPASANDGISTYAKYAAPYGHIDKTAGHANLTHYPLQGHGEAVNQLLANHGHSPYYVGGPHGRPDYANKNYSTKHLAIHHPLKDRVDPASAEYTDSWRKTHELAHALTYPEINRLYGEGRRQGILGEHRTLRESLRAVHWEWLAAHKQRELHAQMGINISDADFHKELNTVMHDAVHRAVTGKYKEPADEGFRPFDHKVPLETALNTVREAAHNLGLQGPHDTLHKSEGTNMADDKELSVEEVRIALANSLKKKVEEHAEELRKLRARELKKNMPPAADLCPMCGNPDVPGQCTCLQPQPGLAKNAIMGYGPKAGGGAGGAMPKAPSPTPPPAPGMVKEEMCKAGDACKNEMCGTHGPKLEKQAMKPTPVAQANKEIGGFKRIAGGNPAPTGAATISNPQKMGKDEMKEVKRQIVTEKPVKGAKLPGDKIPKAKHTDGSGKIKKGKALSKSEELRKDVQADAPAKSAAVTNPRRMAPAKLPGMTPPGQGHPETRASLAQVSALKPKLDASPEVNESMAQVSSLAPGGAGRAALEGAAPAPKPMPNAGLKTMAQKTLAAASPTPAQDAQPKAAPPRQVSQADALKEDMRAGGVGWLNRIRNLFSKPVADAQGMEHGAGNIQNNLRTKANAQDLKANPVAPVTPGAQSRLLRASTAGLMVRSEPIEVDLKKHLGACVLCGKTEHPGNCS